MRHEEYQLQCIAVTWFKIQYPNRIIFAIPNGARTRLLEAVRLKRQGLLKGVPDVFIPEPSSSFSGLFVEFKSYKGRISPEQKQMLEALKMKGYDVGVCRELQEFQVKVKNYFSIKKGEEKNEY